MPAGLEFPPVSVAPSDPRNLGMIGNHDAALAGTRGEYLKLLHVNPFRYSRTALAEMACEFDRYPSVTLVAAPTAFVDELANAADPP